MAKKVTENEEVKTPKAEVKPEVVVEAEAEVVAEVEAEVVAEVVAEVEAEVVAEVKAPKVEQEKAPKVKLEAEVVAPAAYARKQELPTLTVVVPDTAGTQEIAVQGTTGDVLRGYTV